MVLKLHSKPEFPEQWIPLFQPAPADWPIKTAYGGRGGAKSWSFVRAQLILAVKRPLFWLHARELQRSIKESVHKLIADQITALQMNYLWEVREQEIVGANGSRQVFAGIRNNITAIKSMEGLDGASVYEANGVPKPSWEIFLPTIRRDAPHGPFGKGSEVWIEFNPELETDDTYEMFVLKAPPEAILINVNWADNPWFPDILRRQKDAKYRDDPDAARTIWGGKTRRTVDGAIYAKELARAIEDGRVGPNIRPVRGRGVTVSFDLGDQDMTSMWIIQQVGNEHNVIDHYANCGEDIVHFLEVLQERRYNVSRILLPPDAKQQHQAARRLGNLNTIEKQVRAVYPTEGIVQIVPGTKVVTRINVLRALFPRLNFNELTCREGLKSLAHYRYGVNAETQQRTQEPLHDWASHDADALGYYAVKLIEGKRDEPTDEDYEGRVSQFARGHAQGWMQ